MSIMHREMNQWAKTSKKTSPTQSINEAKKFQSFFNLMKSQLSVGRQKPGLSTTDTTQWDLYNFRNFIKSPPESLICEHASDSTSPKYVP